MSTKQVYYGIYYGPITCAGRANTDITGITGLHACAHTRTNAPTNTRYLARVISTRNTRNMSNKAGYRADLQ